MAYLLKEFQQKSDFRPQMDAVMPDDPTSVRKQGVVHVVDANHAFSQACERVCKFVERQFEVVVHALDGRNLDLYLTFVGTSLHQ